MKLSKILLIPVVLAAELTTVSGGATSYQVRFLDNKDSIITTSTGMNALANNILFKEEVVTKGECVARPSENPSLEGFNFTGWYTEKECENKYNFESTIESNLTLYAGYEKIKEQVGTVDEYQEYVVSYKESLDDTLNVPVNITGILNQSINSNSVSLSVQGIKKLEANASNCLRYVNYQRKSSVTDLSATYANNKITIKYSTVEQVINVNQTSYALTNSTYENKAKKYDNYEIKDYSIIMGGSSSMENWSTSKEDMSGFETTNIGIGGTIVQQWDGTLNQRLVYPNNPKAVVYYLGINNIINNKDSGTDTGNMLTSMFTNIHEALPNTVIYFILINYVPGYMSYKDEITTSNNIVKEYSKNKNYICLIDAGSLLMKSNGNPNWGYFKTDGLHMSLAGYVVWGGEVKRAMIEFEKKYYGVK